MSAPPSQPPGWYYAPGDPPSTHRWWDGSQWVGGPVGRGVGDSVGAPPIRTEGYGGSPGHGPFGANHPFSGPFAGRPVYAGFWQRLGALLLDNLILGVPLGMSRAIGRFFAHWVSGFLCYLGYFWMLWDEEKQTWHDKMTDAVVVKVPR